MRTLIRSLEVASTDGFYHFDQFSDGNPLPQIELYRIEDGQAIKANNVLREVRNLNEEFLYKTEYRTKNRKHPINIREFADKFIKSCQGN